MRILHVITGLNSGGAEAVLYRLMTDTRHTHQVISLMHPGMYGPLLEARGVTVHSLGMPRGRIRLGALIRLWRLARRIRPDVIQTWMYHADFVGGVVGTLAGTRAIVWGIRNSRLDDTSSRVTRVLVRILAWLSRLVPRVIVSCSEDAVQMHSALGYRRDKFVVIPNGYDLTSLAPDPAARARLRAEVGVKEGEFLFGMVGRWDPQKDYETIAKSLERLAAIDPGDWRCILVGSSLTDANAELVSLLERAKVRGRVLLLGPRRDVPAVMNAIDVHVLSSVSEAFPNVVAEAMACGTPCVVTDVGDAKLIVGDTGWVAPIRDPERLADRLREAMAAARVPSEWLRRKAACRERILRNYPLQLMIDRYHEVWTRAAIGAAGR